MPALPLALPDNWPDRGRCLDLKGCPRGSGEPATKVLTRLSELRVKLDTTVVNGPEGMFFDWDTVRWHQAEEHVRQLRQRIFAASQAGDLQRVRNLQKLMLRS